MPRCDQREPHYHLALGPQLFGPPVLKLEPAPMVAKPYPGKCEHCGAEFTIPRFTEPASVPVMFKTCGSCDPTGGVAVTRAKTKRPAALPDLERPATSPDLPPLL